MARAFAATEAGRPWPCDRGSWADDEERVSLLVELTDPASAGAAGGRQRRDAAVRPAGPGRAGAVRPGVEDRTRTSALSVTELCLSGSAGAELPETLLLGAAEATARPAAVHVVERGHGRRGGPRGGPAHRLTQNLVPPDPELTGGSPVLETACCSAGPGPAADRDVAAAVAVATGRGAPASLWSSSTATTGTPSRPWPRARGRPPGGPARRRRRQRRPTAGARAPRSSCATRAYVPVSAEHLLAHLDDVDVRVLDNPYDEMRPAGLAAAALAERGVRLVCRAVRRGRDRRRADGHAVVEPAAAAARLAVVRPDRGPPADVRRPLPHRVGARSRGRVGQAGPARERQPGPRGHGPACAARPRAGGAVEPALPRSGPRAGRRSRRTSSRCCGGSGPTPM